MVTFTVMPSTVVLNADIGAGPAIVDRFLSDGHSVTAVGASDVDRTSLGALFRSIAPDGIDVLINNAPRLEDAPIGEAAFDAFVSSVDRAINQTWSACREATALALATGRRLVVVNVVSVLGDVALAGSAPVACTSSAVIAVTEALAVELGAHGIRVTCVMVGPSGQTESTISDFAGYRPLSEPLEPADVAASVMFLAGPDARFITGETVTVDAGWRPYGWHRGGP